MGLNTTVMLLNDRLGDIQRDPEFGKALSHDVSMLGYEHAYSSTAVGTKIIETHHADTMAIIAVGHNMGIKLGYAVIEGNDLVNAAEEAKIDMLKQLADSLGYRLVKHKRG